MSEKISSKEKVHTVYEGDKGITVNMAGPARTEAFEKGIVSLEEYCNAVPPAKEISGLKNPRLTTGIGGSYKEQFFYK